MQGKPMVIDTTSRIEIPEQPSSNAADGRRTSDFYYNQAELYRQGKSTVNLNALNHD